jgi:hypothetical protein
MRCERCGEEDQKLGGRRNLLEKSHIRPPVGKFATELLNEIAKDWDNWIFILCPNCHKKFDWQYPEPLNRETYCEYVIEFLKTLKYPSDFTRGFIMTKWKL